MSNSSTKASESPNVYPPNSTQFRLSPNIYPKPNELVKLILPGLTDQESLARPSILENASTNELIKMLNFKIWAENKVNTNVYSTLSDVIKAELKLFEDHGFPKRTNFQVNAIRFSSGV